MGFEFYSISSHPGKTGTWFYSRFFSLHGLNHTYHALGGDSIENAIKSFRDNRSARGLSVSMPFKKEVISHLDEISSECSDHGICNTVIKENERLVGHNCDHQGALHVRSIVPENHRVTILGNGAIGTMLSRVLEKSSPLIFSPSLGNWNDRHQETEVVINATAVGTKCGGSPIEFIPHGTRLVVDLAIRPGSLKEQCDAKGIPYVGGLEFYRYQLALQYKLYTGIEIDSRDLDEAFQRYQELHPS